ncbi:extracellular solute-binding protein [Vallicoccus soli]|uniref:Extracellular solute-binding protein n=1 Tax=Vallicoccus soli TaxID=2339232 RepID=A0A3A3Z3I0_9ACTN|nr:extracellular solute-binding protein [Vallicoccus soli]RJK97964.1 extracellular solute-binding protein [Vallicoccus soli]
MRFPTPARALLGAAGAVALLVSCAPSDEGSAGGSAAGEGGDQTVTVWSWRTEDAAAYEQIFDAYEEANPGVTVDFRAFKNTEYNQILSTGLTGDGGPDVAQLRAYGQLQPLVEGGDLVPLPDDVDVAGFDETVLEGARGREDGELYGVPFAVQTLQVYYNKGLFADNGIEVPTTWEEMLQAAQTLQEAGVTPFAVGAKDAWTLPILHDIVGSARYGGPQFEQQVLSGEKDFTDPAWVDSLGLLGQLQPYMPEDVVGVAYTDAQVLFTSGQAAMFPGGSFELGFFQEQAPDLDMGVFEVPPPPGSVLTEPVTPGYADGSFGVSAASDAPDAAMDLVRWMATPEFGQAFTDAVKQLSPVPGVEPSDPLLQEMATNYEESGAPYLMLVDFRYGQPLGTDLVGTGVQELLLGQKDAPAVAQDVQAGISSWFTPQG